MYLEDQGEANSTCRTGFSNSKFRYGWEFNGSLITMWYPNDKGKTVKVRCISVLQ